MMRPPVEGMTMLCPFGNKFEREGTRAANAKTIILGSRRMQRTARFVNDGFRGCPKSGEPETLF
jgi:hypothetical protein